MGAEAGKAQVLSLFGAVDELDPQGSRLAALRQRSMHDAVCRVPKTRLLDNWVNRGTLNLEPLDDHREDLIGDLLR